MRQKIFWGLILFFIIFSLWPTYYELSRVNDLSPQRAFELVHNFPTDYNFYLSRIRQGIEGRSTVVEKYTSEPHEGSFIQVLYLFFGRLGQFMRVPWGRSGDVYHMARIAFGVTLLWVIAKLAQRLFREFPWQVIGFLLAVEASTWPKLVEQFDGWRFGGYMAWWSVMDSLQRITFIPHLLFGQFLFAALLILLSDMTILTRPGNWIFLGVLGFILGIIFPPGLVFVYATLGVVVLLELFFDFKHMKARAWLSWGVSHIAPRAIFGLVSFPALLYLTLMITFYPWKRLAEVDIIRPLPFNYVEYIKALGPMLPLGLLGAIVALIRRERRMLVVLAWVISWIALLIVFHFVPQQSPLRFSEMIPHVPLGMLTAYLFYTLAVRFRPRWVAFVVPGFLIILGLGIMYSSWLWQRDFVDHKIRATMPLVPTGSYVMYPLKDFISAMSFIQDATPRTTVVLSETTAGNYMPVYSGNTVYTGHDNTVRMEEKNILVKAFFSGQMPTNQAYDWIIKENIGIVFFGPQEREDGAIVNLTSYYPFLVEMYKNDYVIVYGIKR